MAGTAATTNPILIKMPEPIDLYAILGLARDATQAQISTAYRTQLRRYHPDSRSPADTTRAATSDAALQHVLTAYTVLRDPARRFAYDQQTTPRSSPNHTQARPIHPSRIRMSRIRMSRIRMSRIRMSRIRPFDDPPLRAGPVHWTP